VEKQNEANTTRERGRLTAKNETGRQAPPVSIEGRIQGATEAQSFVAASHLLVHRDTSRSDSSGRRCWPPRASSTWLLCGSTASAAPFPAGTRHVQVERVRVQFLAADD